MTETPKDAIPADKWTRDDLAMGLAAIDGITLRQVRTTVGDPQDANNWREYLGRADDLLAFLSRASRAPDGAAKEDWRDDPAADERWNAGLDYGMQQFCKVLSVDPADVTWDAATETLDGDVQAVICNILRTWSGDDWVDLPATRKLLLAGQGDDNGAKPVAWLWTNEFGKKVADVFMPSSLNNAAPLYLAHDGVEAGLREALTRIKAATPNNTNSSTAEEMASWTKTVAACALDRHTDPAPSSPDAEMVEELRNCHQFVASMRASGVNNCTPLLDRIDALLAKHGGKS